jgi:uncharacterized protein YciI
MTRWIAIFEDNGPEVSVPVRAAHLDDHLKFLEANKAKVVLAGPLREDLEAPATAGLWVFEADSKDEVKAIIEADPFFKQGLRKSIRILQWGKAAFYGDVIL